MTKVTTPLCVLMFLLAGCASDEAATGIDEWAGTTLHFQSRGTFEGESVDLALTPAEAADRETFACVRKYEAPLVAGAQDLSRATFHEVKLKGAIVVHGQRRGFEIELKRHDFGKDAAGTSLKVIPRDDAAMPARGELWFEWEWADLASGETLKDRSAQEGTFELQTMTGTPDANGIIPDHTGTFGGLLHARFSESESVSISFTAGCRENEIESDQ